jgi:hypothetical protein
VEEHDSIIAVVLAMQESRTARAVREETPRRLAMYILKSKGMYGNFENDYADEIVEFVETCCSL